MNQNIEYSYKCNYRGSLICSWCWNPIDDIEQTHCNCCKRKFNGWASDPETKFQNSSCKNK